MAGPHTRTPSNPSNYSELFLSTGVSKSTRAFSTSITFYKSLLFTPWSINQQSLHFQLVFGGTLIFEAGIK